MTGEKIRCFRKCITFLPTCLLRKLHPGSSRVFGLLTKVSFRVMAFPKLDYSLTTCRVPYRLSKQEEKPRAMCAAKKWGPKSGVGEALERRGARGHFRGERTAAGYLM